MLRIVHQNRNEYVFEMLQVLVICTNEILYTLAILQCKRCKAMHFMQPITHYDENAHRQPPSSTKKPTNKSQNNDAKCPLTTMQQPHAQCAATIHDAPSLTPHSPRPVVPVAGPSVAVVDRTPRFRQRCLQNGTPRQLGPNKFLLWDDSRCSHPEQGSQAEERASGPRGLDWQSRLAGQAQRGRLTPFRRVDWRCGTRVAVDTTGGELGEDGPGNLVVPGG